MKYQPHANWDYGPHVYHDLSDVPREDIAAFIDALYAGEFEYVHETKPDFYDGAQQTHLYFHLDDSTIIELRLFEGGYVGYQHLGWYFVKMPGEAFDAVFRACR